MVAVRMKLNKPFCNIVLQDLQILCRNYHSLSKVQDRYLSYRSFQCTTEIKGVHSSQIVNKLCCSRYLHLKNNTHKLCINQKSVGLLPGKERQFSRRIHTLSSFQRFSMVNKLVKPVRGTFLQMENSSLTVRSPMTGSQSASWTKSGTKSASTTTEDPSSLLNPITRLQKFVAMPILKEDQIIFNPTMKEIQKGIELFRPSHKHEIKFLKSAVLTEHLPVYDGNKEIPEVAFIGRSNVGKSSLIQSILGGGKNVMVRVSKTPGQTKLMNFFQVGQKLCVVDMPGYGHRMPADYVEMVETFLSTRKNLRMTFLLIDGKHGPTYLDTVKLDRLINMKINFCLVLTKIDKTKASGLLKNLMSVLKYREQTKFCYPQPFCVSAHTHEGISLLQAFVANISGNLNIDGTRGPYKT